MNIDGQRLLDLLPALYRLRDAEVAAGQGLSGGTAGPLEALLTLVAEQLAIVSGNLDQLYDDQFIETCAPWVLPYIGDLIGYQAVNGVAPAVASPRAEVAHTISFRRRKGTVLVLEQLARDVTGWGAHAVEFFRVLAGTQYMNHIRATLLSTAWRIASMCVMSPADGAGTTSRISASFCGRSTPTARRCRHPRRQPLRSATESTRWARIYRSSPALSLRVRRSRPRRSR
jgi:hypothetical protein